METFQQVQEAAEYYRLCWQAVIKCNTDQKSVLEAVKKRISEQADQKSVRISELESRINAPETPETIRAVFGQELDELRRNIPGVTEEDRKLFKEITANGEKALSDLRNSTLRNLIKQARAELDKIQLDTLGKAEPVLGLRWIESTKQEFNALESCTNGNGTETG